MRMDVFRHLEALELEAKSFGFYWESPLQILQQMVSECDEIRENLEQVSTQSASTLQEEIGDLLHAAFSLCVFRGFSTEETLKNAVDKFEKRFTAVKQLAISQGYSTLHGVSFDVLMALWEQAKLRCTEDKVTDTSLFKLDPRLEETTFMLVDWPLSRVLLKNHADYPWFILVPRKLDLVEITALTAADSMQFMKEVQVISEVVQTYFKPDKLNIGALGNVVSQFHFHVVGRFKSDPLWPQSIWQAAMIDNTYDEPACIIHELKSALEKHFSE